MKDQVNTVLDEWNKKELWTKKLPRYLWRSLRSAPGKLYWYGLHNGCRITEEDWDNLLLLDACRYDAFQEVCFENYDHRLSLGSSTTEFVNKNFISGHHYDIVYVTANPIVDRYASDQFHDLISVWKDGWDEDLNTVPPATMVNAVLDAHKKYPNKRIIGHFLQPHVPYIGPSAENLPQTANIQNRRKKVLGDEVEEVTTPIDLIEDGEINRDRLWEAYIESLEIAFDELVGMADDLEGKTVISSDHGEMFDEFSWAAFGRRSGHPTAVPAKQLIKVPWWPLEHSHRKDIIEEEPNDASSEAMDRDELEEKLSHLGYKMD